MDCRIENGPGHAVLHVELESGERIEAVPGATIERSSSVVVDPKDNDGGAIGMLRDAIGGSGDSTRNVYEAGGTGGTITFAPVLHGDIARVDLGETGRIDVQSGSILAWTPAVERDFDPDAPSGMFSDPDLDLLGLGGTGTAFLAAAGSVRERTLGPGETPIVDEDHVVAWTDDLDLVRDADDSVKGSLVDADGTVGRFEGSGRLWLQTRDPTFLRQDETGRF